MKRFINLFLVLLVAASLTVSGCKKKNTATQEKPVEKSEQYIKIGGVFSVSGPASFLGQPEKNTAEMIVEDINKKGGILGKKIKLIVYDTEGDEQKAVTAVNRLIQKDKVVAIIGPSRSGTTLAVIPIVMRAKIPLISCAASRKIVQPVSERKYVFTTPQLDTYAVEKLYDYFNKKGYKKIAILTVNNGFGASGREQLKLLAPKYNIEIVADEIYGPKDTDMTAQLTKIKSLNPDAIVVWGTNPGPAVIAKNRLQLGIKTPLFMSHGVASKKFIELAGKDAAEGIILPAGRLIVADQLPDTDPQKKLLLDYIAEYKAKYGTEPSTFGGHAYDALHLLLEAIRRAGSTNGDKIVAALETIKNFPGTGGIYNLSPQDHEGLSKDAFVLVKIHDGNWVLLTE